MDEQLILNDNLLDLHELALDKIQVLEDRIAELEAFVEKAMANPMIAGMLG